MVSKKVIVINEQGMHMRPAGILAKAVKAHPDCEVTLQANGKTVKAKAPMQIMSACMKKGCEVEIVCNGAEEQAVLDEVVALFEDGFGE
ncbi:MAG: HPr family phosphocarrier protein [Ruminococcus sp.]|nr:HPr family phosphocarrier protein [Ruminococcus sp.]CDE29768.1 phosphotransferase System HPr (HPr) Family [Ruminococcus sp. CAG:403]